ncbi:transposase, partial [Jeotgalibaca sp. A127]
MAIDEFKSVKSAEGAMSLIICDSDNKKIFDILEDRRNKSIIDYFMRFPQEQRAKVKTVVVDLYGPYQKLFQDLFPQAALIIDRFHIVTQVNRALNMARVSFMNTLKKSKDLKANRDYRKLKKYWKLILKKEETLNSTE